MKKRKEELVKQFNQTEQQINQLLTLREQIRGKLILLQELEAENKKTQNDGSKKPEGTIH